MKELIIKAAQKNTKIDSASFEDLHLLKLKSIVDLDSVKDLMNEFAVDSIEDKENRKYIAEDIGAGITFAFWFDEDGKLEYSR